MLKGLAKAVSPAASTGMSQRSLHARIQLFSPAAPASTGRDSPRAQPGALPSSIGAADAATGPYRHAWSSFGNGDSLNKSVADPAAADSIKAEADKAGAGLSEAVEASQLTLTSERQALPEVATARAADDDASVATSAGMLDARHAVGMTPPSTGQVLIHLLSKLVAWIAISLRIHLFCQRHGIIASQ